ncbi:MAG: LysR family transcriptional regulator, partial [Pseudonocardiaceae bacterium]
MQPQGRVRVPPADAVAGLLECPPALLDITLDQLRTLLVVHSTGTALNAARKLGREQSSIQKQLDTLNRTFQKLCGELLVVKQGRGQDVLFTPTGEEAVELARSTFAKWLQGVHTARCRLGSTLTIGTTDFTLRFLGDVWPQLAEKFQQREIEIKVVRVRTRDFWTKLDAQQVDLICGSFATRAGREPGLEYDFIEWHREGLAILTNLPKGELAAQAINTAKFSTLPFLAPTTGLLVEFLRRWYGPNYRDRLNVIADIDDIYYGLALLRSKIVHGCLLTTSAIATAAVEGRLLGGPDVRRVEMADDFDPALELVTGIFGRKGERDHYTPDHPLNLLWTAFQQEALRQQQRSTP